MGFREGNWLHDSWEFRVPRGIAGETVLQDRFVWVPRMTTLPRGASWVLVAFLSIAVLGLAGPASGALQKPSYSPGDRWVFVLDGSLEALPGLNATGIGDFRFGLAGRVDVQVLGAVDLPRPLGVVRTYQVEILTTGFLNGTFSFPGAPGTVHVTGTFTSSSSEFWEAAGLLPIESHSNTSYAADVTYLFGTTRLTMDLRLDATTSAGSIPAFDLDVGQRATANLTTHLKANSTVTFLGRTQSSDNETDASFVWQREVVARNSVTVEAESFSTYQLNQTMGAFPGVPAATGGNETAYFSNDVGFYVKRVAYQNNSPVSEMRLKSYSYAAGPRTSGGISLDLLLFIAIPAALVVVGLIVLRRRASRHRNRENPGGLPPPPTHEGKGGGNAR